MIRFMGFGGYGPQLRLLRKTGCHQGIVCVESSLCDVCPLIFHYRNVIASNRNGCHVSQVRRIDCSMKLMPVMQVYYETENDDNCGWSIIVAIGRGDL